MSKERYNGGYHTTKEGGKGSRRRHHSPEISQEKWDRIFGKKKCKEKKSQSSSST